MLDLNGGHCVTCKNTVGAAIRGHNELRNAFAILARYARFNAVCEPNTGTMLVGEISSNNIKHYLPKITTKRQTKAFMTALYNAGNYHLSLAERLEGLVTAAKAMPVNSTHANSIERAHAQEHDEDGTAEHGGRRLDISLTSVYTNELVGDVSRIHPTTPSRVKQPLSLIHT